jgi:hypothetical protein
VSLFWDQLLQFIDGGYVVPVVGRDLLTVNAQGRQMNLYMLAAEKLADYLGVPGDSLPQGAEINAVVCRYLSTGARLEDVYSALKIVMPSETELPVPEALEKLAAIKPFKLFVTTTFDSLLTHAIDQARFEGKNRTRVYSYAPNNVDDLDSPMKEMNVPAVYHLFGKLSAIPDYAVTHEDILEFVHALQSESRQPGLLFDELNGSNLLILGCGLGGWLARFFMRAAKRQRLINARGRTDYVADAKISQDGNMVYFLKHFSTHTKVYTSGDAQQFIDELHRRWTDQKKCGAAVPTTETQASGNRTNADEGAVFLSYASEDSHLVRRLKETLEAEHVEVFFDKDDLKAGNDFENRIRNCIGSCSIFVPVISKNTLTGRRRFFRLEWNEAIGEDLKSSPVQPFIVPVVIDDTLPGEPAVPEKFRKLHWHHLPDGQTSKEFVSRIKQLYRQYQKLYAGAVQ